MKTAEMQEFSRATDAQIGGKYTGNYLTWRHHVNTLLQWCPDRWAVIVLDGPTSTCTGRSNVEVCRRELAKFSDGKSGDMIPYTADFCGDRDVVNGVMIRVFAGPMNDVPTGAWVKFCDLCRNADGYGAFDSGHAEKLRMAKTVAGVRRQIADTLEVDVSAVPEVAAQNVVDYYIRANSEFAFDVVCGDGGTLPLPAVIFFLTLVAADLALRKRVYGG